MNSELSLQERYALANTCFGCGPSNEKGLRIRSFPQGDKVVAHWKGETMHEAFPGMLNGGIIGSLLDCHSNWTAAWHLMKASGADNPPCTVTARYSIELKRPTPSDAELEIVAWVEKSSEDRATIHAELHANGKLCATCEGLFVAVKEGHPAWHRW